MRHWNGEDAVICVDVSKHIESESLYRKLWSYANNIAFTIAQKPIDAVCWWSYFIFMHHYDSPVFSHHSGIFRVYIQCVLISEHPVYRPFTSLHSLVLHRKRVRSIQFTPSKPWSWWHMISMQMQFSTRLASFMAIGRKNIWDISPVHPLVFVFYVQCITASGW